MLLWTTSVRATKAIPLIFLAALAVGVHAWLRRSAHRKLASTPVAEFLRSCQVPPEGEATALRVRTSIAEAFGVSPDRIAAELPLRELMALTGWFGSDLLALGEVQHAVDALAPNAGEVRPERTVCEVVRSVVG
jgi:hypothetical protein